MGWPRGSGLTRWLGVLGAVVLAAGLFAAYAGVVSADVSSVWNYCGAAPCRCPELDIQTTWPDQSIVCFTPAPDSAYSMAKLGSGAATVGALLLAAGALLRVSQVGWKWLAIRSSH
jgi:hypothetical protein